MGLKKHSINLNNIEHMFIGNKEDRENNLLCFIYMVLLVLKM